MTSLRRHVPDLALDWMMEAPDSRHRSIEGSLCFADISGFTALAERLAQRGRAGGEELVETLGRIFGGMLDLARERGGSLLKFGGDALLLFFAGEDHAARAAGCALEMQRALRRAAKMRTSVGPLRLSMSVGIHSGPVDFFLVGEGHRELVVLGPAATSTVATEGAANAREIAVSEDTAARLPVGAVRAREDGQLMLRWRTAPPPRHPLAEVPVPDEVVRALFPRALGEHLAAGPPEPEHRAACIAFLRFSGTDGLLVQAGPEVVAKALDATLGTIQRSFAAEGVTLLAVDIDRDGGKVFAATGVPHASEDDEGAMLRALRRILELGTPLPLQVGVNRGHVFVAEVGTPHRAAYSAMGDTTNTAARIASKTPPGAIYAHPAVLDYSLTLFDVAPAGPFTFKGKKAPLLVYQVGDERGTRAREGISAFAFVGRDAEAGALREAFAEVAAGRGGIFSIVGGSGLGKTRLIRETLSQFPPQALLSLRSEPYGATSPYRPFRDPIRALLGIERGDVAAMRAALERGVRTASAALLPWLALLGDVAQIEIPPSPEVAALDPRFRLDRTADAVIQLIAATHPGSVVIVAEDAHWADEASVHLLGRIARECGERPWLLVVARREASTGFQPPAAVCEVRLDPLPDTAIEALIISASEAAPLRPHELALLVRRAGGNPLFALEALRAAREAGSLDAVPDSLEAALAAQVDALDPVARRLLRHASVLGQSFSRGVLSEVLGGEDHPAALERLAGFLEPEAAGRLSFRNGLARDTIYAGLAYRLRARLHRAVGETMERLAADPALAADSLALHFSLAGDHPRTWRYARMAGARARRAYANADAARLFQVAIDSGRALDDVSDSERVAVYRELGEVCGLAGMFEKSLEAYQRAGRLVGGDPVARAELFLGQARARERAGEFSQAFRILGKARRLVAAQGSPEAARTMARLLSFAALVRMAQQRNREALRMGERAAEQARACGEHVALARSLEVMDLAALALGATDAGGRLEEALSIHRELGDLRLQGAAMNNLGIVSAQGGRWTEAVDWWRSSRDATTRSGDSVGAATTDINLGEMLAKQGRGEEAEATLVPAIRVLRATHQADMAAYAEIQLARARLVQGNPSEADRIAGAARAEFEAMGQPGNAVEASLVQAFARIRMADAPGASDLIETAAARLGDSAGALTPSLAHARASTLLALKRVDEAERQIDVGLVSARAQGFRYEEALLLALRRAVASRSGRAPDPSDERKIADTVAALGVRRLDP